MARATSGSVVTSLGGLGFWLAVLSVWVLPRWAVPILIKILDKKIENDRTKQTTGD